jgi:hypothetical protein
MAALEIAKLPKIFLIIFSTPEGFFQIRISYCPTIVGLAVPA